MGEQAQKAELEEEAARKSKFFAKDSKAKCAA
jgi:hypothetical protein